MTPLDDHNWQPATFRERGVAVPFTSPLLAGARLRLTDRRYDLVVPHPAGARGVYIFALGSLTEFCTPTLHDLRLKERLSGLRPVCPYGVRLSARAVAAEGAAGRAAAAAAVSAFDLERQMGQRFCTFLLQGLLRGDGEATGANPEQRVAQAVRKLAGRTGRDAAAVRADIERLSNLLAQAGLDTTSSANPGGNARGRCGLLLDAMDATRGGMSAWAAAAGGSTAGEQVDMAAKAVAAAGRLVLGATRRLLCDPAALLNAWAAGQDAVEARLCRTDWLLDGWEHLCLLWRLAETDDQRAEAAAEACVLLPPVPPETESWLDGAAPELMLQLRNRRHAAVNRAPRPASQVISVTARNERIRAMAA